MHILLILIIAISLSMDAFSLSLAYGTLNISNKNMRDLSIVVGTYHFFMPLLGMFVGNTLLYIVPIGTDILVFCVLTFIGIQMILESKKTEVEVKIMNFKELLLFGLAVSLDSFSVGMGLSFITKHFILGSLVFSIASAFFTYLGLHLGKKINNHIGNISTLLGGLILIFIGIVYLF